MTARRYAEDTTVPVERSEAELRRLLRAHGAETVAAFNDARGNAGVVFGLAGRMVRLELTVPTRTAILQACEKDQPRGWWSMSQGKRGEYVAKRAEQAERQSWRTLVLVTKAKLELVAGGLSTVEREFLADVLLPDGSRVGDWLRPQLASVYESGHMPPLLPGGHSG